MFSGGGELKEHCRYAESRANPALSSLLLCAPPDQNLPNPRRQHRRDVKTDEPVVRAEAQMSNRDMWQLLKARTQLPLLLLCGADLCAQRTASFTPSIPGTWDDAAIADLEVPLANPIGSPKHVHADYYYRIPVRKVYKQYPLYAPGREPVGYKDWLAKQEPVVLRDDADPRPSLKTEADWIKAGEIVFSAPIFTEADDDGVLALSDIRSKDWYLEGGVPISRDGIVPFIHYVIREKGKMELT
jgi:hypothetical protein